MSGWSAFWRSAILFELDAIERFPTVKDFLSYSRLVKGSVASAGKVKGLTGGKMGNAYLRWAFGEAAVLGKRHRAPMGPRTQDLLVGKQASPVALNGPLRLGRSILL
jgi:transposase